MVNPEYLQSFVHSTIENIDLVHGVKPDAFPWSGPICTHLRVMAEKVECLENLTCETLGIALVAFDSNK
jgi:hypothetical protein